MLMNDHAIGEDREPELQPHGVHDVAAERLQHDRELEGAQNPRGTAAC